MASNHCCNVVCASVSGVPSKAAGCSLYEVQKILGHSSVIMTQRYSHLSQDSLLRAASHAGAVVTGQAQA